VAFVHIILVEAGFGACTVVSVGLIDVAFFCTNPECRSLIIREVKSGDCYFSCFVVASMNELKSFLFDKQSVPERIWVLSFTHLRLSKHVNEPTANRAIRTTRDQIVCILRSNHLHRIHWVGVSSR